MGNIEVVGIDKDRSAASQIVPSKHTAKVLELIGSSFDALEKALCTKIITSGRGSMIEKNLDKVGAATSRESFAMCLYSNLFDAIVSIVNTSLDVVDTVNSTAEGKGTFCGILDVSTIYIIAVIIYYI